MFLSLLADLLKGKLSKVLVLLSLLIKLSKGKLG